MKESQTEKPLNEQVKESRTSEAPNYLPQHISVLQISCKWASIWALELEQKWKILLLLEKINLRGACYENAKNNSLRKINE